MGHDSSIKNKEHIIAWTMPIKLKYDDNDVKPRHYLFKKKTIRKYKKKFFFFQKKIFFNSDCLYVMAL